MQLFFLRLRKRMQAQWISFPFLRRERKTEGAGSNLSEQRRGGEGEEPLGSVLKRRRTLGRSYLQLIIIFIVQRVLARKYPRNDKPLHHWPSTLRQQQPSLQFHFFSNSYSFIPKFTATPCVYTPLSVLTLPLKYFEKYYPIVISRLSSFLYIMFLSQQIFKAMQLPSQRGTLSRLWLWPFMCSQQSCRCCGSSNRLKMWSHPFYRFTMVQPFFQLVIVSLNPSGTGDSLIPTMILSLAYNSNPKGSSEDSSKPFFLRQMWCWVHCEGREFLKCWQRRGQYTVGQWKWQTTSGKQSGLSSSSLTVLIDSSNSKQQRSLLLCRTASLMQE